MASSDSQTPTIKTEPRESQPMASSDSQTPTIKTEPRESQTTGQAEHVTHVFRYQFRRSANKHNEVSCLSPGTVLEALQRSQKFQKYFTKEAKEKEIVIERGEHSVIIATHFPCCLIKKDELLTIHMIPTTTGETSDTRNGVEGGRLCTFSVSTVGGERSKTKQLLKNKKLSKFSQLRIYAYEGETIEDALWRDGHFADTVFQKNCELYEVTRRVCVELESLVHAGNVNHFEIKLGNRERNPPSKYFPKLMAGSTISASSSSVSVQAGSSQSPPQSLSNPDEAAAEKPSPTPKNTYKPIADSEEVLKILRSQFDGLVKLMKERENVKTFPEVLRLLREEFGKNTQVFWKVSQMKKLVELSESVCQICFKNEAVGTGFLLFDHLILTNAHVIKNNVNNDGILTPPANVIFTTENSSEQAGRREYDVERVVCWFYNFNVENEMNQYMDYAFLEIRSDPTNQLPPRLFGKYAPPPQRGGICLIGYPEDSEKRIDLSSIITHEERGSAINKHIQEHSSFYQYMIKANQEENWGELKLMEKGRHLVTYNTCFFHGSSGSPVFGDHCQLIAMHSGGYCYEVDKASKTQSIIEYAIPLSSILEHCLNLALFSGERSTMSESDVKGRISFIARFIAHIVLEWKPEFEKMMSTVLDTVMTCEQENLKQELGLETINAMHANGIFQEFMKDPMKECSLLTLYKFLCEKDRDTFINQ